MKPGRTTLRAVLWVTVAAAALLALGSCPNPVADLLNSKSWGLLGTWVSSMTIEYSPGRFYKLTVNADGTFRTENLNGSMSTEGAYAIDSVAVSGNSRTYMIDYSWGPPATVAHHYVLARVTDGITYESVYNSVGPYPSSIVPGSPEYLVATLQ